ncbi:hypothetical protein IPM62_03430 [Candidatus Woesebacteria bacterium]|nr:MAG: hypothetical protein IPM62_03430 [Candidatus Woesebacteria bacterium]
MENIKPNARAYELFLAQHGINPVDEKEIVPGINPQRLSYLRHLRAQEYLQGKKGRKKKSRR